MAAPNEVAAMRRAVVLAAHGPVRGVNPRVGCVVLDTQLTVWDAAAPTTHLRTAARLRLTDVARLGDDVRLTLTTDPHH